jgi:hypothetical protein
LMEYPSTPSMKTLVCHPGFRGRLVQRTSSQGYPIEKPRLAHHPPHPVDPPLRYSDIPNSYSPKGPSSDLIILPPSSRFSPAIIQRHSYPPPECLALLISRTTSSLSSYQDAWWKETASSSYH